jgi:hypothetical protein
VAYVAWLLIVFGIIFATTRWSRLITEDRIGLPLRRYIINRFGTEHAMSYLVLCPWCVSPYIATILTIPALFLLHGMPWDQRIFIGFLLIPTASWVAGRLNTGGE